MAHLAFLARILLAGAVSFRHFLSRKHFFRRSFGRSFVPLFQRRRHSLRSFGAVSLSLLLSLCLSVLSLVCSFARPSLDPPVCRRARLCFLPRPRRLPPSLALIAALPFARRFPTLLGGIFIQKWIVSSTRAISRRQYQLENAFSKIEAISVPIPL